MPHKFNVGQTVQFQPSEGFPRTTAGGLYDVTRQLPERNGEFEYRVKSRNEPHERIVKESELIGTDRIVPPA
jgi:hypothetical protein